jgi:glycosyltransferase involved in cell wall biosynthesis
MRIVHVSQYYNDSMSYQENILPIHQSNLGHEVIILTSPLTNSFIKDRTRGCGEYYDKNFKIRRIGIKKEFLDRFVIFQSLYKNLKELKPDLIYHHGMTSPSIFTCIKYKKNYECLLKVDCHMDNKNSMNGLIGYIYQRYLWRPILRYLQKYFNGIDYVAPSSLDFLRSVYKLDESLYNFTVLGGDSSILKDADHYKKKVREEYNINKDDLVLVHCGKLDNLKRTKELLIAFNKIKENNIKLLIIGSFEENYKKELERYLRDNRIIYVGWKNSRDMLNYFCAGDVLVQPGSLSAVFQNAMCCGIPVILDNTSMGEYLTENECGILINGENPESIRAGILRFIDNPEFYKKNCLRYAIPKLDYSEIAKKSLLIKQTFNQ